MLDLISSCAHLLIHDDLNHWLEIVGVEELIVELAIDDVEGQRRSLHDWNTIDVET